MRIQCDNVATRAIGLSRFGRYRIEFSKNGFAVVPDNVGRYCVRKYSKIHEVVKTTPAEKASGKKTPAVKKVSGKKTPVMKTAESSEVTEKAGDSDGCS